MVAGKRFIDDLRTRHLLSETTEIVIHVYGQLAATAKEYLTHEAIIVGLSGFEPRTIDAGAMPTLVLDALQSQSISVSGDNSPSTRKISLDIACIDKYLPLHRNGMVFQAFNRKRPIHSATYYSVGYGRILDEDEFKAGGAKLDLDFAFTSASDLVDACDEAGLSISAMTLKHESAKAGTKFVTEQIACLWATMQESIQRGLNTEGVLPGPLRVPRRASQLYRRLVVFDQTNKNPAIFMDWVNAFAMAVSEENAAGGRVVTAPTNGACGIIPAVLSYFDKFVHPLSPEMVMRFLMTSGMIGLLYLSKSSILGSEMGCQGEVGVACSMAAGGLAEILGGSPQRVCNAAEIGMEHNLGLTCDPVNAQVQIPCIERNAIAAVKAINAANMAMLRASDQCVSLDKVIEAMYETGKDMNIKYRETYRGGLSTKVFRRKL